MLFVQRTIATFSHVSLETEYNAVRVINCTILRGYFSFSVQPMVYISYMNAFKVHTNYLIINSVSVRLRLN